MIWVIGPALSEVVIRDLHENAQGRPSDLQMAGAGKESYHMLLTQAPERCGPVIPVGQSGQDMG